MDPRFKLKYFCDEAVAENKEIVIKEILQSTDRIVYPRNSINSSVNGENMFDFYERQKTKKWHVFVPGTLEI